MKAWVAAVVVATTTMAAAAQEMAPLPRRGDWGAAFVDPSGGRAGVEVRRVTAGGPASGAGLLPGDRVLRVDGTLLADAIVWSRVDGAVRAGQTVRLLVQRNEAVRELTLTLAARPRETFACCDVVHGEVLGPSGHRLRTIVTRPRGAQGRLPAIFLTAWLSCDSVEYPEPTDGWGHLLRGLIEESGFVTFRVDKPGVGDSEGTCADTDYAMELAGYRAAAAQLRGLDFVDPGAIFLLGGSLGGFTAPLVAPEVKPRAIMVYGTLVKTWYEHMLEIERRRLALLGTDAGAINERMKGYAELFSRFLHDKRTPREVLRERPHLATLWADEPEHLYGRPAAFYHQVQESNGVAAWEKVAVPVLSVHGSHDWIMTREDQEMIVDIVNRRHPGRARFLGVPQADHGLYVHPTPEQAFRDYRSGRFARPVLDAMLAFMREVMRR